MKLFKIYIEKLSSIKYRSVSILILILLFSTFFRIYNVGGESLWLDEAISVKFAEKDLLKITYDTAKDVHPPLYYYLLNLWIKIFGNSESSTRGLSALFGILLIIFVFLLTRKMYGIKAALTASLLLGFSTFHIKYSQETRSYELLSFLSVTSFYYLHNLIIENRKQDLIFFITSTVLLLYTHLYGIFIFGSQILLGCFFIFYKIKEVNTKRILLSFISIVFLFIPWIPVLLKQIMRVQKGFWIEKPSLFNLVNLVGEYSGTYKNFTIIIISSIFTLLLIIYFIKVFNSTETSNQFRDNKLMKLNNMILISWLLIPIFIPFIISQFTSSIFTIKNTISSSIPFFIIAAFMLTKIHNKKWFYCSLTLIVLLMTMNNFTYYQRDNKEPWRQTTEYLKKNINKNDLVLVYPKECKEYPFDYYYDLDNDVLGVRNSELNSHEYLTNYCNHKQNLWIICRIYNLDKVRNIIKKSSYKIQQEIELSSIRLFYLKHPSS